MLINPKHFALILLLIGLVNAGSLRSGKSLYKGDIKCAKQCTDSKNFNYQIGRSYRYNFETKNAFTPETGNALNEVKITGHAKITIQSNCEHVLQLENVNVEGATKDQKEKLIKELEANNLAYSFQDGEINNVCPLAIDSKNAHILNIKKAILSALQFSPKQQLNDLSTSNVDEKDINGNCETTYELQTANADLYKIIKSKKLKSCTNRLSVDSSMLGTSVLAGEITNLFVNMQIQNDHRCKISIKKSGIIESVKCTESSDGAKYVQKDLRNLHEISLKFSNEEPIHYPQLNGEYYEDTLLGEFIDLIDEDENKVTSGQDLKNAIQGVCQSISNSTLNFQTATKFHELVSAVRHSKIEAIRIELTNLLSKREMSNKNHNEMMAASTCCPHKLFKLYLESLISARTDASLKLLVSDIVPNNFYLQEGSVRAEIKLISFYTSLAFYRHPSEETLRSALPLLKLKGRHSRNAVFSVTGLARTICKKEPNCNVPAITELANSIAENIPANCAVKSSNENQVIESLKALENLQKLPEPVLKKVISCLSANVSPNVKVSAIKNFDDKTEQEIVKKAIKDVLFNTNEQDEVRIQAYKLYRYEMTKEKGKEFEKLVSPAKGELASYIANDIQNYRNLKNVNCNHVKQFVEATNDIDLKLAQQQGKSKQISSYPLRPFLKSNLKVKTDVMYSPKTEKPVNVISTFMIHQKKVLEIGLRSESGSNLLLNVANVETIIDGIMQLVRNVNSKQEDGKARLIDEWAAKIFPELANAFKDVDIYINVGGRNLVYISKNDQPVAVSSRLDKLKLGLAPILALDQNSILQIHSVSGMPTIVKKDKTILSNFVLFDSEKVNKNEIKFEITPNLVITQLVKVSYPIGRHLNNFALENEQYMTTNFGLKGSKVDSNDKTQIRLKLSNPKVELLSHRIFNRIRDGSNVKNVPSTRKNRDLCLEQVLPVRKMLGVSVCSRNTDDEKSIVLEKTEDSNVLITIQKEKNGALDNKKIIIEQENSPHKRKISVSMGQNEPGSHTLHFEIENPLGKGWAKVTTSKDKLNVQAKLDDHQVYSLEADKSLDTKGKESNFKANVKVSFPGLQKPFSTSLTTKMINDKKFHVSAELAINEKTRLVTYEYNAENKHSRAKRAADYSFKSDSDLKVFNTKGNTLLHWKLDSESTMTTAKATHVIEYPESRKNLEKLEKLTLDTKFDFERGNVDKCNLAIEVKSTQAPKLLNFKYDHKFVYKYKHHELEHYENDINMEFDILGQGDQRKIRLGQVSTMKTMYKGSKKSSMDHLVRIVINKLNYNREITYNGEYALLKDNIYQINDKLKVQDLSTSGEVLSASISLKPEDATNNKLKLLIDYNCNKHGKFNWAEQMTYDEKTKNLSTKIVLTVSRADQQSPTVYNGEYVGTEDFWAPKSCELKLRKASDNTEVLHIKHDHSKPNQKMDSIDYYGKRVFDFELKNAKDKFVDSLKVKVDKLGELKLDSSSNANEGDKYNYKLKLDGDKAYQQNAVLVYGKKVLSFDFNVQKGDTKTTQIELYLSNPKKTLVTYRDVESSSFMVKCHNSQISLKHENQATGFSSMFEAQKLDAKKKLTVMATKDVSKFALMTKLERDGQAVYTFDSTYSKTAPSVINFKSDKIVLNVNVNPFGSNEDDWKVLTIDFARKDGKYKHTSKINIKKLANKKHALAVKSSSSGKRMNDKNFEHDLDFQLSHDWQSVKLNAKLSEGDKLDQLDYQHDFSTQDMKGMSFKLDHHVKITVKSELIFSHELNSKLDHQVENKKYEFTSNSELKGKCRYINGIKLNLKGNCDTKDKTGKFDLNLEHPHNNNVVTASYNAKNQLKEKFMRELKVEVQNTKLNEKSLYLAKVDLIDGVEVHLKYNKQSSKGHNLENLELRALSKPEEVSLVIVAPRGWSSHVRFLPPNSKSANMSFSLNLTKRGRVLLAVDTKFQMKQNGRKRRAISWNKNTEATINTVIGFNGNAKFAEENIEVTADQLNYKFTSVYFNVDANLKGISSEKKTLYLKGCSAKQVTNCAVLDANIERSSKGAKSQGSFKYGLDDEAITIKYDYNRQKLDNGDYSGKLNGNINDKQFTGEILLKKNSELSVKINLPERVIQFTREMTPTGFKYVLLPNMVKDKAHEHTFSYSVNKSLAKKVHELVMTHPSFKRPLKATIEVVQNSQTKSFKVELDVTDDEKKKLNLQVYKHQQGKKSSEVGMHMYREDRKIDFGFMEEKTVTEEKNLVKVVFKRSQHWVDKTGKNRTLVRNEEAIVKSDDKAAIFDVTSKSLYQSVKNYFNMEGKMHLDLKQRVANGVYDWAVDSLTKKKTEFDYKNRCLKIDSYELPKESYKSNHLINLCALGRMSDSDLVKFEYIKPEYSPKKKLVNSEKLLFKLSKAEEQQLRLLIKWDPEQIGEWIVEGGELIEQQQKEEEEVMKLIQSEFEDKINLLKEQFEDGLIMPMRKHRQETFNEILKEINPKLAAKLRTRRAAVMKNDTESSLLGFSENLAKKLFNFKVVKFSPEDGVIEVLFNIHPTFEGIKYGMKSSINYLFKE